MKRPKTLGNLYGLPHPARVLAGVVKDDRRRALVFYANHLTKLVTSKGSQAKHRERREAMRRVEA